MREQLIVFYVTEKKLFLSGGKDLQNQTNLNRRSTLMVLSEINSVLCFCLRKRNQYTEEI